MRKPVVGVIGNAHRVENRFQVQMVGERNLRAVAEVSCGLPVMFAGSPDITDIAALLDAVDGIGQTGARANVHPARFNVEPREKHEPYDIHRDEVALALSIAPASRAVSRCSASAGHSGDERRLRRLAAPGDPRNPGRMNHRMPRLENGEIYPDPTVALLLPSCRPPHTGRCLRKAPRVLKIRSIRCTARAS